MRTSQAGIDLIKEFEGFRSSMYYDAAGKPTIGYGTLIDTASEQKYLTQPITETEAEVLLRSDVRSAEDVVSRYVTAKLQQNQFDALVSLVYNIGSGNFSRSTLLKKINAKAPDEEISIWWKVWNKAGGQTLTGLIRRRSEELDLFFLRARPGVGQTKMDHHSGSNSACPVCGRVSETK